MSRAALETVEGMYTANREEKNSVLRGENGVIGTIPAKSAKFAIE